MATLVELLTALRPEVEAQVKPNLGGLLGAFVRGYLPQTWTFRTDQETATFHVDAQGNATVTPDAAANPDVVIMADHAFLVQALGARQGRGLPGAETFRVLPRTPKGRVAFDFVRGRIGL